MELTDENKKQNDYSRTVTAEYPEYHPVTSPYPEYHFSLMVVHDPEGTTVTYKLLMKTETKHDPGLDAALGLFSEYVNILKPQVKAEATE